MAYTNAAEHLRYATLIAMRDHDREPFNAFTLTVPTAAREMPLHLLPTPLPIASATSARASIANKRAMLRVMTNSEARESDYTLAWFCAASLLGEECCALAEAGVHTLAHLRTFHESNALDCSTRDRQDRLRALVPHSYFAAALMLQTQRARNAITLNEYCARFCSDEVKRVAPRYVADKGAFAQKRATFEELSAIGAMMKNDSARESQYTFFYFLAARGLASYAFTLTEGRGALHLGQVLGSQ
ncbi:MAG: hypothetical protein SGPRY_009283 [Prymnesium sp.]